MSLKDTIADDMKTAMREKDTVRLETIRLLRSAVQRKEVDDQVALDDAGVLQIVQKMVKQCRDAADQFEKGDRADLVEKELANIQVLETYLPDQLTDQEIDAIIDDAISQTGAETMKDMGKVMGIVKSKTQGNVDMGVVSTRIKTRLT